MNQQINKDNLIASLKEAYCCKCSEEIQSTCLGETCIQQEQIIAEHDKEVRNKVLKAFKKELQTRFISSSNQWSKGRNSGLLECCNIIDESLMLEGNGGE